MNFLSSTRDRVLNLIRSVNFQASSKRQLFFAFLLVTLSPVVFTGCHKEGPGPKENVPQQSASPQGTSEGVLVFPGILNSTTFHELKEARSATARYQNIDNALNDGYQDIGLVMPNMGYHFMKMSLVDSVFDIRKPELLVYNKNLNGKFELGAVEYAVPINPNAPNTPPQGFTGPDDVWDYNTNNTGLWTLHAWVWKFNPDGVFNPMNPLVHVR